MVRLSRRVRGLRAEEFAAMKRYGSRRNDNDYGDRTPVHGEKSSRAREKREPNAACCPACADAYERWRYCRGCLPDLDSGAIPDQEQSK